MVSNFVLHELTLRSTENRSKQELPLRKAHQDIDWSRKPEFLNKELQQISRGAKTGAPYQVPVQTVN